MLCIKKRYFIFSIFIIVFSYLHIDVIYANENTQFYFDRSVYSESSQELPKILSNEDLQKYHNAYLLQKKGQFKDADNVLNTLDNPILIGYIYYIRYTQTSYNTSYDDLKDWLNKYSHLSVAHLIYKKATRLSKNDAQHNLLKKPKSFYARFVPIYKTHDFYKNIDPVLPSKSLNRVNISSNRITDALKIHLKRGKTLTVKQILLSENTIKNLDPDTYDHYASILTKLYFLDGEDRLAVVWGKKAARRNPYSFAESTFTVGLAYYRLKEYSRSVESFEKLMQPSKLSDSMVSKGAYWYAKVSLMLGNIEEYYRGLRLASKYIYNFYGLIASEELGISPEYTWKYVSFPIESIEVLKNNDYSRRALALLQLGLIDWAEQELVLLANYDLNNMNRSISYNMLNALIYMAQQIPMPALGIRFAGERGKYYGLSHLSYPIFFVELESKYELDPALLLAVMRRESSFYSGAMSGPGATGLMQIMPTTAKYVIEKNNLDYQFTSILTSPKANIDIGQRYVQQLIKITDGNLIYTLGSFNAGAYNVDKWKVEKHRMVDDPLFFIESIPYRETRNYVKSVTTDYWIYQYKLGLNHYSLYSLAQGKQPLYYAIDKSIISNLKNFSYKPKELEVTY